MAAFRTLDGGHSIAGWRRLGLLGGTAIQRLGRQDVANRALFFTALPHALTAFASACSRSRFSRFGKVVFAIPLRSRTHSTGSPPFLMTEASRSLTQTSSYQATAASTNLGVSLCSTGCWPLAPVLPTVSTRRCSRSLCRASRRLRRVHPKDIRRPLRLRHGPSPGRPLIAVPCLGRRVLIGQEPQHLPLVRMGVEQHADEIARPIFVCSDTCFPEVFTRQA